jgi:hypothetical protein
MTSGFSATKLRGTVLAAAMLLASGGFAANSGQSAGPDRSCVVGEITWTEPAEQGQFGLTLFLPDSGLAETGLQISPVCSGSNLQSLSISAPADRPVELTLVFSHSASRALNIDSGGGLDGATVLDSVQINPASFTADRSAATALLVKFGDLNALTRGASRTFSLEWTVDDGEDVHVLTLPVELTIQAGDSLFKDRFEVDPVLGQFSYRSTPRKPDQSRSSSFANRPVGTGE